MEFRKIDLGPIELIEDRKSKQNHLNQLKIFCLTRVTKTWSSLKIHSRASIVHNIYINDLPLRRNSVSEPILFVDDTSVIISSRNFEDFCSVSNLVLSHMIKWFDVNNLVLNLHKTNRLKFIKFYVTYRL